MLPWIISAIFAVSLAVVVRRARAERRAAARALASTNATLTRIRQAVESASDAIGIGDMASNSLYHNRAHIDLFGYSVADLNNADEPAALFADKAVAREIHDSIRAGRSWHGETDIKAKDGRVFPAFVRADIIRDDQGNAVGIFGVFTDISERRQQELALRASEERLRATNASLEIAVEEARQLARAAEAANEAKSAFLATMSHEIRTPLNGVIGMTNILTETPLTSEQREYLRTIKLSGEALLTIINDTLDYSKIEAGKIELEQQPFDIVTCAEESIDLVAASARKKGLTLKHLLAPGVPRMVVGDATRLRQILINLLGNAVKFTARGTVTLELTALFRQGAACTLRLAVTDTGIGIPKEKQNRLFQRFSQVDASNTRQFGGTGLGLAISKRLAELMNGSIAVESEEGKGATFVVTVPFTIAPDEVLAGRDEIFRRLRGRRVLIVDDNPVNCRVLELQTMHAGMVSQTCQSGPEALSLLTTGARFDLIISDKQMPGMDGPGFVQQLQARGLKRCPILLLSSVGHDGTPDGVDAVLNKPAKASQFYQVIVGLLHGHDAKTPASSPALPAASPPPPGPAAPAPLLGHEMPLEILITDDNTVNQRVAQVTLRKLGYEPHIASDGAQAVALALETAFDVILMDVQMPGMDGLEATRKIRAALQTPERPWIIALTAGAFEEDRANAHNAGMNDFLNKPLRVELLRTALVRAYRTLATIEATDSPGAAR